MRLSISIAAAAAFLFTSTSAFVPAVPSTCSTRSAVLGMSSVAEPEASTSSDAAATSSGNVNVAAGDRQQMYGNELDLPETYVMCGRCKTAYALQADDLGTKGKGRYVLMSFLFWSTSIFLFDR